jgi:transketolase
MEETRIKELQRLAIAVRRDALRVQKTVGSGHLGGAFSAVELLIYLYFQRMRLDPARPDWPERDSFILSKGHAAIGYYSVLARRGFFPHAELDSYRQLGSRLQGHTQLDAAPGIEASTGSLGQGYSFGLGLALGNRKQGRQNTVYVMVGDGELDEGQVWEAVRLQSRLKLAGLVLIVDDNQLQLDDYTRNVNGTADLAAVFRAFGFHPVPTDGHDFAALERAFAALRPDRPNVIIARTVKGKGISFMEDRIEWHAKKASEAEYRQALEELRGQEVALA